MAGRSHEVPELGAGLPRRISIVLIAIVAFAGPAASCSTENEPNTGASKSANGSNSSTTAQRSEIVAGPQLAEYRAGEWQELPPSPLGAHQQYNWVWLTDGSGFVQAGATDGAGAGIEPSLGAAYFSFADRRYYELPDLPVESGVGPGATGVRVGNVLVITGHDCPSTTSISMMGAELCAAGAAGAKVVVTLDLDDDRWVRHALPERLHDYRFGSPRVLGVRDGKVLVASEHARNRFAEFDPTDGSWAEAGEAPELPVEGNSATTESTCFSGGRLVVTYVRQQPTTGGSKVLIRTSTDGSEWSEPTSLLPEGTPGTTLEGPVCTPAGFFATRATGAGQEDNSLYFVDPATLAARLVTDQSTALPALGDPAAGSAVMLQPMFSLEPPQTRQFADADGVTDVTTGKLAYPQLTWPFLVDLGPTGDYISEQQPRVLLLDPPA